MTHVIEASAGKSVWRVSYITETVVEEFEEKEAETEICRRYGILNGPGDQPR